MTFNESLNHVRIGRHGANPNEGFRKQLEFFEQTLVSKGVSTFAAVFFAMTHPLVCAMTPAYLTADCGVGIPDR